MIKLGENLENFSENRDRFYQNCKLKYGPWCSAAGVALPAIGKFENVICEGI